MTKLEKLKHYGYEVLIIIRQSITADKISVVDPDPDPYWIRIQWDHLIRIRIRNFNTDPDPGGQK